ncbi:hypothetical protein [Neptuniibacter sp.]|uniref:hypothetical protein n=1 Tax=Neptuniibacter sp. TaxID=1962643 RepID=UPI003B5D0006
MNQEIEKLLADKFPIYQRDENIPSCFNYWGFECGDGWIPLLCDFADEVNNLNLNHFRIEQIKEKYFRLIIYIDAEGANSDIAAAEDLTHLFEVQSMTRCERCGEPKSKEHKCNERYKDPNKMLEWAREIINRK